MLRKIPRAPFKVGVGCDGGRGEAAGYPRLRAGPCHCLPGWKLAPGFTRALLQLPMLTPILPFAMLPVLQLFSGQRLLYLEFGMVLLQQNVVWFCCNTN